MTRQHIAAMLVFATGLCSCGKGPDKEPSPAIEHPKITEHRQEPEQAKDLTAMAREIHDRVITLDTHIDMDMEDFTPERNYSMDLDTQVNLPKMAKGGLDVAWLAVFASQRELNREGFAKAHQTALQGFEAIHRLVREFAPDQVELALTSEDIRRISAAGKKVIMIGMENGYPIGKEISNVKKFYDLGARYISLTHGGHNQLCDSSSGEVEGKWLHNGLSDLGKQVVEEMNRWGIMVDMSHTSKKCSLDILKTSKAPVIASHSAARALNDHNRNLDDEQLRLLKNNGGVIQTIALSHFLNTQKNEAYEEALKKVHTSIAEPMGFKLLTWQERKKLGEKEQKNYRDTMKLIRKKAEPRLAAEVDPVAPPVDLKEFVNHIDYLVKHIGIDHVGISSDFDGGGGVKGWADASESYNVTLELVRRGYREEQIAKLWSGNLLRVLDEVQEVARQIRENPKP